jgi:uncharacterized membrane protein
MSRRTGEHSCWPKNLCSWRAEKTPRQWQAHGAGQSVQMSSERAHWWRPNRYICLHFFGIFDPRWTTDTTQRFVRFGSLLRCGAERRFLFRPELSDHHDNAHNKSNHAKEAKIAECIVEHGRVRHAGRFDHRISPGVTVAPKTAVDYSAWKWDRVMLRRCRSVRTSMEIGGGTEKASLLC